MIRFCFMVIACLVLAGHCVARPVQSYYYYHGNRSQLVLDRHQLAVRFTTNHTSADALRRISKGNRNAVAALPLGFGQWQIASLHAPLNDADDADKQIRSIAGQAGVDIVSPVFRGKNNDPITLTRDILVKFRSAYAGNPESLLRALTLPCTVVQSTFGGMSGAYRLRSLSSNAFDALALANELIESGYAEWAEPDMIVTGIHELIPNDSLFPRLWGIRNTGQFSGTPGADMQGDLAWNITTGDSSVIVMVIDCGVQQDHPDLHQLPGIDFTGEGGNGGPVNSCDNHGTAVAGCIAASMNNGIGIAGIAPGCFVLSARTLIANPSCDNSYSSQISWTIDALAYAGSHGIRITNFSNQFWSGASDALEAEYQFTHDSLNMIHFAAAGNGSTEVYYPASIPVVNAVGAMKSNGSIASFSNYGSALDFVAPGDSIWVTDRTGSDGYVPGDYKLYCGTSFASPYAAGVAALILSRFPWMTASQVEAKMKNAAVDLGSPGYDTIYGWGFVNAYNAVRSSCIMTAPADIITTRDPGKAGAVVNFSPAALSGSCGPVACIPVSGSLFPVGTTVVTCTDSSGDQCLFRVTVTDKVNTVILRSWFDQDADAATASDRLPKAWGLALYKDSVSPATLVGVVASAESLTVSELYDGTYIAVEADSGGWAVLSVVHNGAQQKAGSPAADTFALSNAGTVRIDFINTELFVYRKSWNLISLPVRVADGSRSFLFPAANSSAFAYYPADGYAEADTLVPGKGYWLRFPENQTSIGIAGVLRHADTIPLTAGWNLIGTLSDPIDTSAVLTVPSGIIASDFFGFSGGYIPAETLKPYLGYWVKSDSNGELILRAGAGNGTGYHSEAKNVEPRSEWNSLTVEDRSGNRQRLYFTSSATGTRPGRRSSDLPPAPPEGIFDVRFADNSFVWLVGQGLAGQIPIRLSSVLPPVTFRWNLQKEILASLDLGNECRLMSGKGSITTGAPGSTVTLRLRGGLNQPRRFLLAQAFPDPFNPTTTIRYDLPNRSRVSLRVYNTLGELVAILKNDVIEQGVVTVVWDGAGFSSGVYFYRLEALGVDGSGISVSDCKKVILLR